MPPNCQAWEPGLLVSQQELIYRKEQINGYYSGSQQSRQKVR